MSDTVTEDKNRDNPPLLGTWKRLYGFVLGIFGLLVLLFYWLTVSFT